MTDLPKGIRPTDLKYPSFKSKDRINYEKGDHGSLTLYEVHDRKGNSWWCIATLRIRKARLGRDGERTYAVRLSDGAPVRIGLGPHVKRKITVYVRQSRVEALQRYIDLHLSGAESAHQIRDRISSRRAQGQVERAQGHSYWRWNA